MDSNQFASEKNKFSSKKQKMDEKDIMRKNKRENYMTLRKSRINDYLNQKRPLFNFGINTNGNNPQFEVAQNTFTQIYLKAISEEVSQFNYKENIQNIEKYIFSFNTLKNASEEDLLIKCVKFRQSLKFLERNDLTANPHSFMSFFVSICLSNNEDFFPFTLAETIQIAEIFIQRNNLKPTDLPNLGFNTLFHYIFNKKADKVDENSFVLLCIFLKLCIQKEKAFKEFIIKFNPIKLLFQFNDKEKSEIISLKIETISEILRENKIPLEPNEEKILFDFVSKFFSLNLNNLNSLQKVVFPHSLDILTYLILSNSDNLRVFGNGSFDTLINTLFTHLEMKTLEDEMFVKSILKFINKLSYDEDDTYSQYLLKQRIIDILIRIIKGNKNIDLLTQIITIFTNLEISKDSVNLKYFFSHNEIIPLLIEIYHSNQSEKVKIECSYSLCNLFNSHDERNIKYLLEKGIVEKYFIPFLKEINEKRNFNQTELGIYFESFIYLSESKELKENILEILLKNGFKEIFDYFLSNFKTENINKDSNITERIFIYIQRIEMFLNNSKDEETEMDLC